MIGIQNYKDIFQATKIKDNLQKQNEGAESTFS